MTAMPAARTARTWFVSARIHRMVESLNLITRQVREAVTGITASSTEIQSATTQQMATRSNRIPP